MAAKKKKYFPVEIPLIREEVELYAFAIEDLNDRSIKLDLTRILRGKGLEASFRVKVEDNKATADVRKAKILSYFIRRMMRKRASYVENSLILETGEPKVKLKIKPFMITRKKVSRAVRNALREGCAKYLTEYTKDKKSDEIFSDVIYGRMQKPFSLAMKKIYPLAFCDIRHLELSITK